MSKTKCIDDALLWSSDITEAFHQAVEWLHICAVDQPWVRAGAKHHDQVVTVSSEDPHEEVCDK